jgi:ABC-2 type transport system permease protein
MVIGSVWGLLLSTRLLRGEEDTGRWDLLLAGQVTRRGATAQALAGLGAAATVLWAVTSVIIAVAGLSARVGIDAGPALFLSLALVSPAAMFLAVGALTSQLAPTRRQAAGYGAVLLGLSYGLRMIGDAGIGWHGLTWLSPLGWVEELAPLTSDRAWPLLLIFAFTGALAVVSVHLASGRDVGSSLLPDRSDRAPRLRLLGSQLGLSARLMSGVAVSWILALAVFGLLFGVVAKAAGETISGSSVGDVLNRLGATGGGLKAYLGVAFLVVAVLIGFVAAGQVSATRTEEAEGRLDNLLVRPLSRLRWLTGCLGLTLALLIVCGVITALCIWLGAATQHAGIDAGRTMAAGLNAVVPAVFLLGIGALLLGWWPRAAAPGLYAILAWSLLVELIGGIGAVSRGLLDTSVFHHVASAPAVPPDWSRNALLCGLGLVAAIAGLMGFNRRDLKETA